jgi:putative FmdB family regulatory protein
MPIYEYCCQSCGHRMEAIQRLADAPLTECPACNEASLKKQVSAPSFRLSGGGWYETDFKTGENKKNLAGDRGSASGSDPATKSSGDSGSSEAAKKPAEKSAAPAKSETSKAS